MPTPAERPPEHVNDRDPMAGRRPWLRIDEARIREDSQRRGEFHVVISVFNLKMAISPPQIIVGDIELDDVSFDKNGEEIRGVLRSAPKGESVTVDYGFARGGTTLRWADADGNSPKGE